MAYFECSDKLRSMLNHLVDTKKKRIHQKENPDTLRGRSRKAFLKISRTIYENRDDEYHEKIGNNMEKSVYNNAIKKMNEIGEVASWDNPKFSAEYMRIGRRVIANLTYTRNAEFLRSKLSNKKLKHTDIAGLDDLSLMSPAMIEDIKESNEILFRTCMSDTPCDESKPGLYTCGVCKSNKTTFTQFQTRSADEPMTVFVRCLNCNKRWRC